MKPLKTDSAKDFNELWKKVIEPNLPEEQSVIEWHEKILMKYIKRMDAIFSLRTYGSPSGNELSPIKWTHKALK